MTTRRSRSFSLKRLLSLLSTASSRCVAVCVLRCVCCGAYVALRLLQCLCCSSPFSTVSSWCVQCLLQYCSMCVALCSDNYGTVCRVTHVKEACHAFELGVSHIWMMRHVSHTNESRHKCEWDTSHIWMRHLTPMNQWVMYHLWTSHVPHLNEARHTHEWVMSHVNESRLQYELFMSHIWIWMSYVSHIYINASCLTYE